MICAGEDLSNAFVSSVIRWKLRKSLHTACSLPSTAMVPGFGIGFTQSQIDTGSDQAFPDYYRRDRRSGVRSESGQNILSRPGEGESDDDDEDRVEYPPMPEKKKLGYISTSALIVSKMVGTGIFVKPATVLLNSGGKSIALALWIAGGLMTLCGALIYIEWGIALPFNGADVIYVEEAYPTPRYLAVIIVSLLFVLCNHFAGNCISFAKLVLQVFNPEEVNPDYRLQKFVAVVLLTSVCLLHVFSRNMGIAINNGLAVYKLCLIIFIIVVGFTAMGGVGGKGITEEYPEYGTENFKNILDVQRMSMNEYSNAVLGVLWAYTGWENANYVLAEVKREPGKGSKVFRIASLGSIGVMTLLYVLANVAYFTVLTTEEILEGGDMIAVKFLFKVFGPGWFTERGIKILISLSILGNFISCTYGVARVKQEIAKLRILPFSRFWAKQSHYDTPAGALFLHWIPAALVIIFSPDNENDDVYNLLTNLFVCVQNWIIITVSLGIFSLRYHRRFGIWRPQMMSWGVLVGIVLIYVPLNIFIVVLTWWPPTVQPRISSYITPGVASGIIVFGFFYWIVFALILPALGYHIDSNPDELIDGSRVVIYKRYKTGPAKRVSDWVDRNIRRKSE